MATPSASLRFDTDGPKFGWKRRVDPVHTMTSTEMDTAEQMGLPHGLSVASVGRSSADAAADAPRVLGSAATPASLCSA